MSKKVSGPVHLKLCLLGDGRVGKTSLRQRYLGKGFITEYLETLGADFAIHTTDVNSFTFRFQIWDLAGQKRFDQLRTSFYYGTQAALLLYAIDSQESFNSANEWIEELWKHNGKKTQIPIVIIGNKSDLREKADDPVLASKGEQFAEKVSKKAGFQIPFMETSAKTGENVKKAFKLITERFIEIHSLIPDDSE